MRIEPAKFCPLIRADCKGLGCNWFVQLRGKHPQTGEPVDEWDCAVKWLPILTIENTKEAIGVSASIDSFRNEMVRGQQAVLLAATNGDPLPASASGDGVVSVARVKEISNARDDRS